MSEIEATLLVAKKITELHDPGMKLSDQEAQQYGAFMLAKRQESHRLHQSVIHTLDGINDLSEQRSRLSSALAGVDVLKQLGEKQFMQRHDRLLKRLQTAREALEEDYIVLATNAALWTELLEQNVAQQ